MDPTNRPDGASAGTEPAWIGWAVRLQALAQDGLAYAANAFDRERYEAIRHIAAEMLATGAGSPVEPVLGLFEGQVGYATPKVDVRAAVFRGDRVLLVKEHADGLWTLPGGWADPGDTPAEAVEREMREESGYEARATRLLAVYDRSRQGHIPPHPFAIYKLFFLCEITGGAAATSVETDEVAFFPVGDLPPLSLARVTPRQIARLYRMAADPACPADFD